MTITLFGLTVFSDNKGCEALAYSFLDLLQELCAQKYISLDITAYIFMPEDKNADLKFSRWQNLSIVVKKNQVKKMEFWKELKQDVKNSSLCFDFTEGDSFTDLYGLKRFCVQTFIKSFVLKYSKNFILGPQTYGPYKTKFAKNWAKRVINKSKSVYSRDELSQKLLSTMTKRKVQVVTDVAVALKTELTSVIETDKIKVGVNVSGLLWNGGYTLNNQFNLSVDYKVYIETLIKKLSENDAAKVYLIPHVITEDDFDSVENDLKVCLEMHKKYPKTEVIENNFSPSALKGMISQMDVFTGARMHSTIAAFSTKVTVIPFSYSRKFEGFFGALGYNYVVDGKTLSTDEAVKMTLEYIYKRKELRKAVCKSYEAAEKKIAMFKSEIGELLELK